MVTVAKGWPQMKLVTRKIMSSLLCVFWWRNVHINFFTTLTYRAFITKNELFELYQSKSYMEPSPPSVRGCMRQIWLWCNITTLRYDVTQLSPFWGWDMAWDGPNQQTYLKQENFLTYVAHLFKLQDIQNSSQTIVYCFAEFGF